MPICVPVRVDRDHHGQRNAHRQRDFSPESKIPQRKIDLSAAACGYQPVCQSNTQKIFTCAVVLIQQTGGGRETSHSEVTATD
jgi:hypothetical protein